MVEPYEGRPGWFAKSGNQTAGPAQAPLKVGMLGWSLEDINKGKKGYALFPIGRLDSTKWGGREWLKKQVTAMEDVRGNRDIIVANEQGEIKEHTPVELSYEKREGGYQRVAEETPLPVTQSRRATTYYHALVTSTVAGTTELVASVSGKRIVVLWYAISNHEIAVSDVGLQFGSSDRQHCYQLPASGGSITANLTDAPFQGGSEEALNAYLGGAYATGIDFNIAYILEDMT